MSPGFLSEHMIHALGRGVPGALSTPSIHIHLCFTPSYWCSSLLPTPVAWNLYYKSRFLNLLKTIKLNTCSLKWRCSSCNSICVRGDQTRFMWTATTHMYWKYKNTQYWNSFLAFSLLVNFSLSFCEITLPQCISVCPQLSPSSRKTHCPVFKGSGSD